MQKEQIKVFRKLIKPIRVVKMRKKNPEELFYHTVEAENVTGGKFIQSIREKDNRT